MCCCMVLSIAVSHRTASSFASNLTTHAQRVPQAEQAQLFRMDHIQPLLRCHVQKSRAVAGVMASRAAEHRTLPRLLLRRLPLAPCGWCCAAGFRRCSGSLLGRFAPLLSDRGCNRCCTQRSPDWRLRCGCLRVLPSCNPPCTRRRRSRRPVSGWRFLRFRGVCTVALTLVFGHHSWPDLGIADGPGRRGGRPGGSPACCCDRRLEDPFPQC
jgi:hypothetical protein